VHDLGALTDSGGVGGVNVIDLDRDVRNDGRGLVVGHQADLRTWSAWVRQGDDPAVVHHRLKAEDSPVRALGVLQGPAASQACMDDSFPTLKDHLSASGMLWVSWPKADKLGTDLSLPTVIRIGYSHGMVESTCLSVDDTWSALKFTHPKPGKTYNNGHGTLPAR